ncbi:MAG: hypothetical protein PHT69_07070 [Bacteroidales bacterium]|nr:hypothetical protein [Bacteroidales bacterium]
MKTKFIEADETFIEKQNTLEYARCTLKQEFIGIDRIIDEVIDNVSSWFFLSDIQEKPVVINLWGLTGVGKTSLVNRLVQLIDYEDAYFRFDLGEKEGSFSFRESLDELCENDDSNPVIIALDEVQHSKTVTGPFREDIENDKNRMIWELLDSGKIHYIDWKRGLWGFEDTIVKLSSLHRAGVFVRNGLVVEGRELYCKEMNENFEEDENVPFVPESDYEKIIEFAGKTLNLHLLQDVRKILMEFSAEDSIEFLHKILRIGKKPSVKNFTKSLIFVMGNLDEAYTMSSNFSADMDADEFHRLSLKITVPDIKQALQNRFRNEQIARLGNIHIIYPALDRKSYIQIIRNELEKYASELHKKFNIKIDFEQSVYDIIYSEGVYPTQGVRPIFTSIHQILKSKLSLFLTEIMLKNLNVDKMFFSIEGKILKCSYNLKKILKHEKQVCIVTPLEDTRKNRKDDVQAITAVHESGHATLAIVLLKTVPEVIYSVTSDSDSHGFVYSSFAWKYISRKEIIPRAAMILGGLVAEELVFGKENLTAGANSDITKATSFLSNMFKFNGMGSTPLTHSIPQIASDFTYHSYEGVEEEIKAAIQEAKQLAEKTLKNEKQLLLALSDYLSDNRMLKKDDIKRIVNRSFTQKTNFIENGEDLFYRNHLKSEVKKSETIKPFLPQFNSAISLNKGEECA